MSTVTFPATLNDGRSTASIPVAVSISGRSLLIRNADGGGAVRAWPLADMRLIDLPRADRPGRLMPAHNRPERLVFSDPALLTAIRTTHGMLRGASYGSARLARLATFLVIGALGSVAVIYFWLLPIFAETVAEMVPTRVEKRIGEVLMPTAIQLLGGDKAQLCVAPAGKTALENLTKRLAAAGAVEIPVQVMVVESKTINAFALPGGFVVFLNGLIEKADDPNEVAGVLAHELAHVLHRHGLVLAIRHAIGGTILGMLLGDVTGGAAVVAAITFMTRTAHSREAEAQADHSALVMLTTARVDGAGMARFFEKLAKLDGSGESWMRYLSTHPPTEERAARARATARGGAPALTAEEWKSLRAICDRKEPPPGRRFRPN